MKIKATLDANVLKCKLKIMHEMRDDFITHIIAKIGDRVIMEISTSQYIAKNPNLKFQVKANDIKIGDTIEVMWTDKEGQTQTGLGKVK